MANVQNNSLQNYLDNNEIYKNKKKLLESNYNTQKDSLLQNYNTQSQGLEQNKKDSQQAAAIAHQKLLKYLPEYNASMGLYGNGASESALLDANARYRSTQGQIAANYNAQKSQLDADHSARQTSLLQNYNQGQMDLYSEAAAAHKSDQESTYNMALNTINSWTGTSGDLKKYKDDLVGRLTEDQFKSLEQAYNTALEVAREDERISGYNIQNIGSTTAKGLDSYSKGANFTVETSNGRYEVQVGESVNDEAISTAALNGKVGTGQVFAYNNELYVSDGENIYEVEKRALSNKYDDLKSDLGLSSQSSETSTQAVGTSGPVTVSKAPTEYSKGKNFTLNIDGEIYSVQLGKGVEDSKIKEAGKSIADGNVFAYDGQLYMKNGNAIYKIANRPWGAIGDAGGYDDARRKLFPEKFRY